MDTYQAIYDAVRSRISGFDGSRLGADIAQQFDISYAVESVRQEYLNAAYVQQSPSVIYKPGLSIDGNQWCALYGDNPQDGVCGFGDSPADAMTDFNNNWAQSIKPKTVDGPLSQIIDEKELQKTLNKLTTKG